MPTGRRHHLHHILQFEGRAVGFVAALVFGLLLSWPPTGRAEQAPAATDHLYRAQTIVTGQGEANRLTGFAACLQDVLIKVAAAGRLADDPRLEAAKANARDYVKGFSYHDQMSGTPTRDEQGTRDRPYDLTVDFDQAKIVSLLATLGLKPWSSHRPVLCGVCRDGAGRAAIHGDVGLAAIRPPKGFAFGRGREARHAYCAADRCGAREMDDHGGCAAGCDVRGCCR